MSDIKNIFTQEQKTLITSAIESAEKDSSAEVRVCITDKCKGNVVECAIKAFKRLKMDKTALRNGVLIYIAVDSHKVAVIGDKGINDLVEKGFWDSVYEIMAREFAVGRMVDGIAAACSEVGVKLKTYFPYKKNDANELSDEIVFEKQV